MCPAPAKRKYLMGAEMLTHHPVSIAADGLALNITVQSYRGRLDLGITACLEAVPDVEGIAGRSGSQLARIACGL